MPPASRPARSPAHGCENRVAVEVQAPCRVPEPAPRETPSGAFGNAHPPPPGQERGSRDTPSSATNSPRAA